MRGAQALTLYETAQVEDCLIDILVVEERELPLSLELAIGWCGDQEAGTASDALDSTWVMSGSGVICAIDPIV